MSNEPAFPCPEYSEATPQNKGMSLRDYFAAKAMQGLCSKEYVKEDFKNPDLNSVVKQIAYDSYKMADAMLAERNRREKP